MGTDDAFVAEVLLVIETSQRECLYYWDATLAHLWAELPGSSASPSTRCSQSLAATSLGVGCLAVLRV